MTPEETCNLPNLLSGSSTGTGARTETGELGGKRTRNSLFFTMWTFKQWEAGSSLWNGEIVLLPGFLGHCWILRDLLQLPLHYCHTSTYGNKSSSQSSHCWSDASSRRGWLPLYLMSFSVSWMPTLNGIYLHFSVKRVSLISLHLVTLHKSLTHFLSVFCGIVWHSTLCLTHFDTLYSVALFGIPWHYWVARSRASGGGLDGRSSKQ